MWYLNVSIPDLCSLPYYNSHEISYFIFSKIKKDAAKCVDCCSRGWRFNG